MINGMVKKDRFSEEELNLLGDYTLASDNDYYGYIRAKQLGIPAEGVSVGPGALVNYVTVDKIGKNVRIGPYTYVNGDITIGDDVLIGPHCALPGGNHIYDPETDRFSKRKDGSIVIGEGSWLASNVTVTSGVKIGRVNLICAGAVVTKDTEDYAIMAGIPAKKIGHIDRETGEYIWG